MYKERQELYQELEDLHRKQRGWQRLINDEQLDYEILDKMNIDELKEIIKIIKGDDNNEKHRNFQYDEIGTELLEILEDDTRACSECGKPIHEGYCIEGGLEYYCSDECLSQHYTEEEYLEMYDDGDGDSYWTEWED